MFANTKNQFSIKDVAEHSAIQSNLVTHAVQTRICSMVLLTIICELKLNNATVPDRLLVHTFQDCRAVLAVVVAMLVRFVLRHILFLAF